MRKLFVSISFLFLSTAIFAGHIAGGEIFYRYVSAGSAPNTSRYHITVRLFRECVPPPNPDPRILTADMPNDVIITIFNNTSPSSKYGSEIDVTRSSFQILQLRAINPCIINAQSICYQVGYFELDKDLPNTADGYIVAFQTCCRTYLVENIQALPLGDASVGNGEGATYSCEIPGTKTVSTNSSAVFGLKDTTLVCNYSPFRLDFGATDPDGDSLSYSLCDAFNRGNAVNSSFPPAGYSYPPFGYVQYTAGFSGSTPLGANVTIDPTTGIISGKAPGAGRYVVNVCITEWRNHVPISQHRKDFTLIVADCSLTTAELKPMYVTCNGTRLSFQNESTSSNIISYLWDFGIPSISTDTSTQPSPVYDYLSSGKDSGTYTVKLKVTASGGCQDSTTSLVKVYPGFAPGFTVKGSCYLNNYLFSDTSTIKYGVVNSRRWDFGDAGSTADTATSKDTAWKYPSPVTAQVRLIVGNSIGCIDTLLQSVQITDRPALQLPFHDTLICSNDTLALKANSAAGTLLWTPSAGPNRSRILNDTSHTPLVYPRDTTRYYVVLTDNGCTNMDSVNVNVLQFISVDAGPDTAICRTDTIQLKPVSYALSYQWTASSGEAVQNVKNPLVRPLTATRYVVIANLGKCQARDSLQVIVVPYPSANAGPDQTICYGSRVQLNATMTGTKFSWTPTSSLVNANTLNPVAGPDKTTVYIFSATDTVGCPRPKYDTVVVTVIPQITAYAGRDTFAFPNQPLQLQASGGTSYSWTPASWLDNATIYNPVATIDGSVDSITYTVRVSDAGCYADSKVKVRMYKSGADIFVPSAFTPNSDGKNDVIKPKLIGIVKLNFFSVYNRWGQLMFTTTQENKGWDGVFNGLPQPSGAYVYQASGVDLSGKLIYKKGTVVLIR